MTSPSSWSLLKLKAIRGCKIGANATCLHDEVVAVVVRLFRLLRVDAIVDPTRLFADDVES